MHPLDQPSSDSPRASSVDGPEPWRSPWSMEDDLPKVRGRSVAPPPAPVISAKPLPPNPPAARAPAVAARSAAPSGVVNPPVADVPAPLRDEKHLAIKRMLAQQQQRRMQRLVVVATGVFVFMLLAWYYTADHELPADSDLLPPVTVADASSVRGPRAPDLLKLALESAVAADLQVTSGQPPWAWDTPLLSQTVRANAVALDNLRDVAGQSDWVPQHDAWKDEDLGSHPKWRDLGLAKVAATAYFARLNDDQAAMQSALELITLARRMQTIHVWPTFYARGVELHQQGCEITGELLRSTQLSARTLALFQAEFERASPSDETLCEALSYFYAFEREYVLGGAPRLQANGVNLSSRLPRLFFKPNQTLELFAKGFRGLREEVRKAPYARIDPVSSLVGPLGAPRTTVGSSNRSGFVHANHRLWPYASLVERQGLQSARHLLVLTSFAIRRYAMEHGALPKTLSDLLPNYFSDLPKDPFNGEPLHYDGQRGLLYSVGQDYIDSGGHVGSLPLGDAYEPTLQIK